MNPPCQTNSVLTMKGMIAVSDEVQCESCCRIFSVIWHNSPEGGPQFCPFCGGDWEENVMDMDDEEQSP